MRTNIHRSLQISSTAIDQKAEQALFYSVLEETTSHYELYKANRAMTLWILLFCAWLNTDFLLQ